MQQPKKNNNAKPQQPAMMPQQMPMMPPFMFPQGMQMLPPGMQMNFPMAPMPPLAGSSLPIPG